MKMPRMPKAPTLSSLRSVKRVVPRATKKKVLAMKPLPPLVKTKEVVEKKERLTHIDHAEDCFIREGDSGLFYTLGMFTEVHNTLVSVMKDSSYKSTAIITEKFDGSPSVVFGHDKETNKFFVATKSFFSKKPKLNFTEDDIKLNHGYSPNLVDKLVVALIYLPKITPAVGIFQGDLMYVQGMNVEMGTDKTAFTANTVTYSCYSDTPVGKKIHESKVGIAIHTQHTDGLYMPANLSLFKKDEDVFVIPPQINLSRTYYPAEYQREFLTLLQEINNTPLVQAEYEEIRRHSVKLMQYINRRVKGTAEPREETEFASPVFDNFFFVHAHLQAAKKILNNSLSATRQFYTEINGQETKGEGFVVTYKNKVTKIVDREEFSRQNFLRQTTVAENLKTIVFSFARMNPPTMGHERLIEIVQRVAKENKAEHLVALSPTTGKNDPLNPSVKLAYLTQLFPAVSFKLIDDTQNFISVLCDLYRKGAEHFIFVAGSDRLNSYQEILEDLNGKDDFFYFKKITMVSSGDRDSNSLGITGISGTKMRQFVLADSFDKFREGLPRTATEDLAARLFADIQAGLRR